MDASARAALSEAMVRLADGDRSAMEEVFRRAAPEVRALAERLLGDPSEANDVTQDVMVDLFARASDFDPDGDALAWALTIAVWHCRTARKKRSRARARSAPVEHAERVSHRSDPEGEAAHREVLAALEVALGTLGDADRDVITQVLAGAPLGAALRKRKERLMVRLRRLLLGEETP